MNEFIMQNEAYVRLAFFIGIFIIMMIWEIFLPRRKLIISRATRWTNNISLVFLNTILLRVLFPITAVGIAVFADNKGLGLFNYLDFSFSVKVLISVIILDLAIYVQHIVFHVVPVLWRLHKVHHIDLDIDVTTGARFHPIEIILSMLIKFFIIIIFGIPAISVVIFEVILSTAAMFNHSNVRLIKVVDKFLRYFIVTPDMHRVHHSVEPKEMNSNFGFNLSIWDRIFKTYKDQPIKGHKNMEIGLSNFKDKKVCSYLGWMLLVPFFKNNKSYDKSK